MTEAALDFLHSSDGGLSLTDLGQFLSFPKVLVSSSKH